MLERRTFIVRVYVHTATPIVEDVFTGEHVRLPDLASIPAEIERRLAGPTGDPPPATGRHDRPSVEPGTRP